jgi:hypothetical protein
MMPQFLSHERQRIGKGGQGLGEHLLAIFHQEASLRMSNMQAIGFWHSLLAAGKKIPISGGSDYHRSQLFLFPGGPTTCVHAMSASPADILSALRLGHAYIVFAPNGPRLEMTAGEALPGDSVLFPTIRKVEIEVDGLQTGDILQVITAQNSTLLLKAATDGSFRGIYTMDSAGFARLEILREFVPGLPPLPALISNPIYFDRFEPDTGCTVS